MGITSYHYRNTSNYKCQQILLAYYDNTRKIYSINGVKGFIMPNFSVTRSDQSSPEEKIFILSCDNPELSISVSIDELRLLCFQSLLLIGDTECMENADEYTDKVPSRIKQIVQLGLTGERTIKLMKDRCYEIEVCRGSAFANSGELRKELLLSNQYLDWYQARLKNEKPT
mgnify:CR=1 FL=1